MKTLNKEQQERFNTLKVFKTPRTDLASVNIPEIGDIIILNEKSNIDKLKNKTLTQIMTSEDLWRMFPDYLYDDIDSYIYDDIDSHLYYNFKYELDAYNLYEKADYEHRNFIQHRLEKIFCEDIDYMLDILEKITLIKDNARKTELITCINKD